MKFDLVKNSFKKFNISYIDFVFLFFTLVLVFSYRSINLLILSFFLFSIFNIIKNKEISKIKDYIIVLIQKYKSFFIAAVCFFILNIANSLIYYHMINFHIIKIYFIPIAVLIIYLYFKDRDINWKKIRFYLLLGMIISFTYVLSTYLGDIINQHTDVDFVKQKVKFSRSFIIIALMFVSILSIKEKKFLFLLPFFLFFLEQDIYLIAYVIGVLILLLNMKFKQYIFAVNFSFVILVFFGFIALYHIYWTNSDLFKDLIPISWDQRFHIWQYSIGKMDSIFFGKSFYWTEHLSNNAPQYLAQEGYEHLSLFQIHSHNLFLEIYLQVGIVGLLNFMLIIFYFLKIISKNNFVLSSLIFAFFIMLSYAEISIYRYYLMSLFSICICLLNLNIITNNKKNEN